MSDYSIYNYYNDLASLKGKGAFLGPYEELFDKKYTGKPEDKEGAFKDYMFEVLHEQAVDTGMAGIPRVDNTVVFGEYIKNYFDPGHNADWYENFRLT
jgi:hypothetical protein